MLHSTSTLSLHITSAVVRATRMAASGVAGAAAATAGTGIGTGAGIAGQARGFLDGGLKC